MAKSYSVIEINGNRYDAVTGQLLGTVTKISHRVRSAPAGVIDGFTRRTAVSTATVLSPPPKAEKNPDKPAAKSSRAVKSPAQSFHKRAQKSMTLMRGAVKKPDKSKTESQLQASHARSLSEHKRAARASKVTRHAKINRFGSASNPTETAALVPAASTAFSQPRTMAAVSHTATAVSEARPVSSRIGNLSGKQLERMLDRALMSADAHKNSSKRSSKLGRLTAMPRWANVGASLLIVLILGGFFAWQNVPQVSMRLAALRADIPASVPGYTPAGFQFSGPIGYSEGAINVHFKANSDSFRSFTIRQEKSSLNSQSLAANLLPKGAQVQTSQVKGTTVYIYGPANDAAWVDKGIMYSIKDQANLTSDQILKIAGSL